MSMMRLSRWREKSPVVLVWVLGTALLMMAGCGQRGAQRQQNLSAMGSSIHQEWTNRLQGDWERVDNQDDVYEATGAPIIRINKENFHQGWSDGTTLDSRWLIVQDDRDVVHIALESKDRAPEIWRLYLYSPQELTVFAPGLPPATYKRRGVQRSELSVPMQDAKQRQARSIEDGRWQQDGQVVQTLSEQNDAAEHNGAPDTSQESSVHYAAASDAAESDAAESDAANQNEGGQENHAQKEEGEKRPNHRELEAIFKKIQHIQDSMTPAERALGERLLLGTWDLTEESLKEANEMRGDDFVPLEGAVLTFGPRQRLSMIWKTANDIVSNGVIWEIEGMYGPELRVILTEQGEGPTRERMQFLDVDHFVLDPNGANMRFERRAQ